ncbi:hypothetical protein [Micrococcus sp.]|uniref:hypothetical protein n=1 Tax=Micrococcus sp. TaxID=1271 RepID=UPI0026DAEDE9|nr:hypothetical protein [Micrococcus sp.]MDO4240861.1 hypothetical protein [Micrococcus sp.]
MSTTQHPLTETAAAELSKKFMPGVAFQILASVSPEDLTEYARLAYDLAREHEREHAQARPAEEVELPGEPCVLTDVRLREALATGLALWTGLEVVAVGFDGCALVYPTWDITAFTLPDGTRARRDGDHADGGPRFVKEATA